MEQSAVMAQLPPFRIRLCLGRNYPRLLERKLSPLAFGWRHSAAPGMRLALNHTQVLSMEIPDEKVTNVFFKQKNSVNVFCCNSR